MIFSFSFTGIWINCQSGGSKVCLYQLSLSFTALKKSCGNSLFHLEFPGHLGIAVNWISIGTRLLVAPVARKMSKSRWAIYTASANGFWNLTINIYGLITQLLKYWAKGPCKRDKLRKHLSWFEFYFLLVIDFSIGNRIRGIIRVYRCLPGSLG